MVPEAQKEAQQEEFMLMNLERTHVLPEGVQALHRWHADMLEAFSEAGLANATLLPGNHPLAAFDQFDQRPPLLIGMAERIAGDLRRHEQTGELLGRELYAWQVGVTKWLVFSLLHSGRSYLIEGGPGVGKTLILGEVLSAAIRQQIAGTLKGTIVIIFNKPFIIDQQSFSVDDRRERLKDSGSRKSNFDLVRRYCLSVFPPAIANNFNSDAWEALVDQNFQNHDHAFTAVANIVRRVGWDDNRIQIYRTELSNLASLLVHDAYLIEDIDPKIPVILHFSERNSRSEPIANREGFSGDLMRCIPQEYIDQGYVATTVPGLNVGEREVSKMSHEARSRIRVLLTTQGKFDKMGMQGGAGSIAEAEVIIIDEGARAATSYQERVAALRAENRLPESDPPLVIMASAMSETNGLMSRPMADAYAPKLPMLESMDGDRQHRQIAPNIGLDVFPRNPDEILYPSSSHETLARIAELHFEDLDIPRDAGTPQPYELNTAVVVSDAAVSDTVALLREGYEKKGVPSTVVAFSLPGVSGKNKIRHQQRTLAWALDDKEIDGPKIIVFSESDFRDALSLPTFSNVLLGTGKSMNERTLRRRIGRMCHIDPRGKPDGFRAMVRQVLTSETSATVFDVMHDEGNPPDTFVPARIVRGKAGAKRDGERHSGLPEHPVPTAQKLRTMRHAKGRPLTTGSLRPTNDRQRLLVALNASFDQIREIAKNERFRLWGNPKVRSDLQIIIARVVWPSFECIIRINKKNWLEGIHPSMLNNSDTAIDMISAAEDFCNRMIESASHHSEGSAIQPSIFTHQTIE